MIDLSEFKNKVKGLLRIDTAKSSLDEAVIEIEALTAENNKLKEQCSDYEKTISAFPLAQQDWDSKIAELKKEYEDKIVTVTTEHTAKVEELTKANTETVEQLTTAIKEEKQSVAAKVTTELASLGVAEGEVKETISGELTPTEALNTFKSLKGKEQTEYYREHSKLIQQAMSR